MLQGSEEEKEQAGMVLQEVLEAARVVAVMLTPVVPALARLIYLQLGFTDQQFEALTWEDAQWGGKTCFGQCDGAFCCVCLVGCCSGCFACFALLAVACWLM